MKIGKIFERERVEYYGAVSYSELAVINKRAEGRIRFTPKSVIVFLLPYYLEECENISKYAASRDYHIAVKEITARIIESLSAELPNNQFMGFGDISPIDERYAAAKAGLGVIGDNGLLINEKYGSYVFLCEIITDAAVSDLGGEVNGQIQGCLHCGKCKAACPTGILRGDGESCLSEITQRKGELSDYELGLMRKCGTVWGCDICQDVCPLNKKRTKTPIEFFYEKRVQRLTEELLASLSDDEFSERAFSWRGRAVLERNLKNEKLSK